VFIIIAYFYSSTQFEIRTEPVLQSERGRGREGKGGGQGGEMIQTMYSHVNK
jgi:hypothetical protein